MRQSGYYWVKYGENWIIAEYDRELGEWFVAGNEPTWLDSEFDEIDETQITRQ